MQYIISIFLAILKTHSESFISPQLAQGLVDNHFSGLFTFALSLPTFLWCIFSDSLWISYKPLHFPLVSGEQ